MMNLRGGAAGNESYLRAYKRSGTIFAIVSLLAEATAGPAWHLYKKAPRDGRVRYTTADRGTDQRTEVVQHAALTLWDQPNSYYSGFEFREMSQQYFELAGECFWVLDRENALRIPTAMWVVRPDKMLPVPSDDGLIAGWMFTGPNGEQVPLLRDEVIHERRPDPEDPFRGTGGIQPVMANIEQQDYATQYQRNLFLNGANPGAIITVPDAMNDSDFDQMVDRWREAHQGVARAGRIAVLTNGSTYAAPAGSNNKDMEYGNLRLQNRDELRESSRMHKHMLGTVDDVNRANAETAEQIFTGWSTVPRLERRRDTLNFKLLPLFGSTAANVEFDFESPEKPDRESDNAELLAKANAAKVFIDAGFDPHAVLEEIGLPDMAVVEKAEQQPALPPGWVPGAPALPSAAPDAEQQAMNALRYLSTLNGHHALEGSRK